MTRVGQCAATDIITIYTNNNGIYVWTNGGGGDKYLALSRLSVYNDRVTFFFFTLYVCWTRVKIILPKYAQVVSIIYNYIRITYACLSNYICWRFVKLFGKGTKSYREKYNILYRNSASILSKQKRHDNNNPCHGGLFFTSYSRFFSRTFSQQKNRFSICRVLYIFISRARY